MVRKCGECIHKSKDDRPPNDVFNQDTAREQCNVEDMGTFDENEVGFSTDGSLSPKVHFYTNDDGRRVKACVHDGRIIHLLRRV